MASVLVADDDALIREWVRFVAEAAGHEVIEAADGEAALALARTRRPDVALLDVRMPGRDGLDLTRAVKGDPTLAGTRVVLLSGMREDAAAALQAGADAHLMKPCPLAALSAALVA